jgi:ubiquinone/menaquinone biosynthesis C-methylase UbiE
MSKGKSLALTAGVLTGAAMVGGWRVYSQRAVTRIPSPEALDDPAVAAAYGRVAATPQMALMRYLVAQRAVHLCPTGEAADIGCGPGQLVIELARQAPNLHITGVDLAAEMLGQAQENAARAGIGRRAMFRLGDANRLPFDEGSLDLVVSTLSLHHWADPAAVLNEVQRVLAPGGAFLIADLRRDMPPPAYLLIWFATRFIVPATLRRVGEPLGSRNAAYDPYEAAKLAQRSQLTGWRITTGPLWLLIEGRKL